MSLNKKDPLAVENIDLHKIYQDTPNRFLLSVAVAKRSKQLKDGVKPLVDYDMSRSGSFVSVALREILEGKLHIENHEKASDEDQILSDMDAFLDAELEEAEKEDTDKKPKETSKVKSKSLGA